MAPIDTQPTFPAADPYLTYMEDQQADERAAYDAKVAAKYSVVSIKSGVEVSGAPVHQHQQSTVTEKVTS